MRIPLATWNGTANVPSLFRLTHDAAVRGLAGTDLATLHQLGARRDLFALGWTEKLEPLRRLFDGLASRDLRERYRIRSDQRSAIFNVLGETLLESPRLAFICAASLDDAFPAFSHEGVALPLRDVDARVTSVPPAFLVDAVKSRPPPVGQMTPLAICRRWFRTFWVQGDLGAFSPFGALPTPRRRELPQLTRATLQAAADDRELRIATVSWRRHSEAQVDLLKPADGLFAVNGLARPLPPGLVADMLRQAADKKAHVLLLPELALQPAELEALRSQLGSEPRRFPALTIAGTAHAPRTDVAGTWLNRAVALNEVGVDVLEHEKIEPYTLGGRLEAVVPRQSVHYDYVDTPIGRLVINVCRDYRADVPMVVNRALGATFIAVPAWSPRLDFVAEEARILGSRQLAISVASSPACEPRPDGEYPLRHLACVYVPVKGPEQMNTRLPSQPQSSDEAPFMVFTVRIEGSEAQLYPLEEADAGRSNSPAEPR